VEVQGICDPHLVMSRRSMLSSRKSSENISFHKRVLLSQLVEVEWAISADLDLVNRPILLPIPYFILVVEVDLETLSQAMALLLKV
jgi:hypothetical protein